MQSEVMLQEVAEPREWVQIAARYKWANPDATWDEVAEAAGKTRQHLGRVRETEQWEIAFRQAGAESVERLAPAAVAALLKQWAKGNAAGAIDVLRGFGFLRPQSLEIKHEITNSIDEELAHLLAEVLGERAAEGR